MKSQSSVELITIVAVLLIILSLWTFSIRSQSAVVRVFDDENSRIYWKSTPIALNQFWFNGEVISFEIQNKLFDEVNITNIAVSGNLIFNGTLILTPGQQNQSNFSFYQVYEDNEPYTFDVNITYSFTRTNQSYIFYGQYALVGRVQE
ncbi:MAG: hypothetical protein ACI8Y7_000125 [Candidatus Woesearchaeota archaeon]|jgi:hypothetical protein